MSSSLTSRVVACGIGLVVTCCAIAVLQIRPSVTADDGFEGDSRLENNQSIFFDGVEFKLGVSVREPNAYQGYTLIAPLMSAETFLIDLEGRVVHQWKHKNLPSLGAQLLENGHLLRCAQIKSQLGSQAGKSETAGRIQEFDWNGELLWDCVLPDENLTQHHDCIKLPNGNVMVTASERKPARAAKEAGWKDWVNEDMPFFPAHCILEIKQTGKTTGAIVWRWNVLDHILQDVDPTKPNFVKPENVADHAELVDLNYQAPIVRTPEQRRREMEALKSIGYLDAAQQPKSTSNEAHDSDWTHFNSVSYNPHFDQVMIGVRQFSEIWIVDHSTTTDQAAGHVGGRYGKGGDLLYRWGNSAAYRCGKPEDQVLFYQHDAHWIPDGLPGAGRLLTFSNGNHRPSGAFSSIEEAVLPADDSGRYPNPTKSGFAPKKPSWSYAAEKKTDFFSSQLSGTQRLPNGNTLICSGMHGVIFETTPDGEIVWKYVNPIGVSSLNGLPAISKRNSLFRAYRYGIDFPAFAGKELRPGPTLADSHIRDSKSH